MSDQIPEAKLRDFVELVRKMRHAQLKHDRSHYHADLQVAKTFEHLVDDALAGRWKDE